MSRDIIGSGYGANGLEPTVYAISNRGAQGADRQAALERLADRRQGRRPERLTPPITSTPSEFS